MADIGASDVTYTVLTQRKLADGRSFNQIKLAFGNSSLTYPAGGIPLTIGNLGCPTTVESLIVFDQGTSGYQYQYDQANKKLIMIQGAGVAHAHNLFIPDNTIADGATTRINAATNSLSQNSGANVTISSVNASVNGGILSATPANAAGAEASAVAIAAQTIKVEVIGW